MTGKTNHRELQQTVHSLSSSSFTYPQSEASIQPQETTIGYNITDGSIDAVRYVTREEDANEESNHSVRKSGCTRTTEENNRLEILKHVWAELFDTDVTSINPSSSFFEYGGDSLAAIELVGLASQKGVQLDVATIFRHPRLSNLASCSKFTANVLPQVPEQFSLLSSEINLDEVASACNTHRENIEDVYPCTPLQEGLITSSDSKAASYFGRATLQLPHKISLSRLKRAWESVVQVHRILRTRIIDLPTEGLVQVILKDNGAACEIKISNSNSYSLTNDNLSMGLGTSLLQYTFLRDKNTRSTYLTVEMHHAIHDGWTLPRLGEELFKAYQGVRLEEGLSFNLFIKYKYCISEAFPNNSRRTSGASSSWEARKPQSFLPCLRTSRIHL